MEPIKMDIAVSVNVNLSEDTKKFIAALYSTCATSSCTQAPAAEEAKAPASAPKTEAPSPKAEAPQKQAVSIEDVRAALSEKVNDHRAAIKEKLTELGAPNITKLDPAKYSDMLNFLNSL